MTVPFFLLVIAGTIGAVIGLFLIMRFPAPTRLADQGAGLAAANK